MWYDVAVFVGGLMAGGTLGVTLLLVFQFTKDIRRVDQVPEGWVLSEDAVRREADAYAAGIEQGIAQAQAAQRDAKRRAGLKAAATRKAK